MAKDSQCNTKAVQLQKPVTHKLREFADLEAYIAEIGSQKPRIHPVTPSFFCTVVGHIDCVDVSLFYGVDSCKRTS